MDVGGGDDEAPDGVAALDLARPVAGIGAVGGDELGGGEMLIGDIIESQFFGATYNPYLGAALSLILMVLVLICMTVMNQFSDDDEEALII